MGVDTAVTTPTLAAVNKIYNNIGGANTNNFSMKVKFVELPNPTFSLVLQMTGHAPRDPRRPYIKTFGRGKIVKLLYGKVRLSKPLHSYGSRKHAALLSIPVSGTYRHGFIVMQYLPFVSTGVGDAAVVTRVYVMLWDRIPPQSKVSEAVAAALAYVARKYGAVMVGEPVTLNVLRPSLHNEDAVGEVGATKVRVWYLNNLPPLPLIEYSTLPLKSMGEK